VPNHFGGTGCCVLFKGDLRWAGMEMIVVEPSSHLEPVLPVYSLESWMYIDI
jgi:hypothetical protein